MDERSHPRTLGREGRYLVVEEIGEGGFARVFRARDSVTNREVALKVLKDAFAADPQVIERFNREVFAIASLSSPHVVTMYDFGLSDEEFFISMEYLQGPTLREVIKDPVWGAAEIHRAVGQIAHALSVAHHRGILHRDLKPENIKLLKGADGAAHVKVLDFGFAKLASLELLLESAPVTRVGTSFGTPQYMSPEQALGKLTDQAMDLYALAIITYELLAGHRPFGGKTAEEVMRAVVSKPAPPIESFHPSITRPADVNRFLERALAKDQKNRPASASEFFLELERALLGPRAETKDTGDVFATVIGRELDHGDGFVKDTMQVTLSEIIAHRIAAQAKGPERVDSAWVMPIVTIDGQADGAGDSEPTTRRKVPAASGSRSSASGVTAKVTLANPAAEVSASTVAAAVASHSRPGVAASAAAFEATTVVDPPANPPRRPTWTWVVPIVLVTAAVGMAIGFLLARS